MPWQTTPTSDARQEDRVLPLLTPVRSESVSRYPRGFTLIEVLIVTAIVAILATIAYPSYTDSVDRSRRADAKAALLQNAQILERCYTRENTYANCNNLLDESPDGYYSIDNDDIDSTSFEIVARPQGVQKRDDGKCKSFSIDHRGTRSAEGSLGDDCW